jgi:hypothetical protein
VTATRTRSAETPRLRHQVDTASTTRMVAFLLARIDDDEDSARRTIRAGGDARRTTGATDAAAQVASAHRLRKECEAKRTVLGQMQQLLALRDLPHEQPVRTAAHEVLQAMVGPYAEHVGCRPEWVK